MATSRHCAGAETIRAMSLQQLVDQIDRLPTDRITVAGVQELLAGSRNPAGSRDVAVTLHVYSLPHDACLAFDLTRRRCERRELAFDPLLAAAV